MSEKQIKIRAVIDSQGLDQQVRGLQQRLDQMRRQQQTAAQATDQYGAGSKMSSLTKTFFGDFNQESIRNLREAFNLNARKLQAEERQLKQKQREMQDLAKIDKQLTEGQKERLKFLKDEVDLLKQKGRTVLEENQKIANQAQSMGSDLGGFKGVGGVPPGQQPPMGMFGRARGFANRVFGAMGGGSALAGVAGAGVAAAGMGADVMMYRATRDREMVRNIAESTRGANVEFQHMMQGRGFMNQFESPERHSAMAMAMQERERRMAADPWKAVASVGGSALQGGVIGAGAGATAFGAFSGGTLSAPGAIAGGIGGALFGAGRKIFGDKGIMRQVFDREAYQGQVTADTVKNFQSNLAALKMAQPGKFAAADMFGQQMPQFQGMQRALNLSDREMFGGERIDPSSQPLIDTEQILRRSPERQGARQRGFLERSMTDRTGTAAFSQERIMQNVQQILQGGGTTEFVGDQLGARMAAEYQRAGFTDASQQLGAISGTGAGTQTESEFRKMMAEAMSLGLDQSELAENTVQANEETRRIMRSFVQIYEATGGAEGAVREFAGGITGGGGAEIRGAMQSFERRNVEAGQGSGYRGALKWAYLNTGEGREEWSGVDEDLKSWATSANLKNLDAEDPMVQRIAREMGVSPDVAMQRVRKVQRRGENYAAETDDARSALKDQYTKFLRDENLKDTAKSRKRFEESEEGNEAVTDYLKLYYRERQDQAAQETAPAKRATAFGAISTQLPEDLQSAVTSKDFEMPTGERAADVQEASKSADQLSQLQILNTHIGNLADSAKENRDANVESKIRTIQLTQQMDVLINLVEKGGTVTPDMLKEMEGMFSPGNISDQQVKMGNTKNKTD